MDIPILCVAVDNHMASLIYCNICFFINGPVVIDGLIDEFACFRRGRSRRFLSPKVKVFQYLFNYKIFADKTDNLHRTAAAGA